MAFSLSERKKDMSTTELAKSVSVNQKSSRLFKRKTLEAMKRSGKYPLDVKLKLMNADWWSGKE